MKKIAIYIVLALIVFSILSSPAVYITKTVSRWQRQVAFKHTAKRYDDHLSPLVAQEVLQVAKRYLDNSFEAERFEQRLNTLKRAGGDYHRGDFNKDSYSEFIMDVSSLLAMWLYDQLPNELASEDRSQEWLEMGEKYPAVQQALEHASLQNKVANIDFGLVWNEALGTPEKYTWEEFEVDEKELETLARQADEALKRLN